MTAPSWRAPIAGVPPVARAHAIVLVTMLAVYFAALLVVNCVLVPYPLDNDLDEIGWIVEHLSVRAPASLVANEVYPFGFPVVLWLLRPIFGLLRAALAWQAVAMTGFVLAVFVAAHRLFGRAWDATCAAVCAAVLTLPLATSEFADGTAAALLVGGWAAFFARPVAPRGLVALGAASGLAWLFRLHYLSLVVFVPIALLVYGLPRRRLATATGWFLLGFAATSWPLLLVNLIVYRNPFHSGVSPYYLGQFMMGLDWKDFPAIYREWSTWRIVTERPLDLARHVAATAANLLARKEIVAAALLAPLGAWLAPPGMVRRHLGFLAAVAVFYTAAIILPTRFTDRAFAPVAAVVALLVAPAAARAAGMLRPAWLGTAAALAVLVVIAYQPRTVYALQMRRWRLERNERVVDALRRHGMTSSRDVFSNDWDVYNLADPKFISFYNYGGWLLLDSRYAAERPPPRATTVAEWEAFVRAQHVRFVIARRTPETAALFSDPDPAGWSRIAAEPPYRVFAVAVHDSE